MIPTNLPEKTLNKVNCTQLPTAEQQMFNALLVRFFTGILKVPLEHLDSEIEQILQEVNSFWGSDRVVLWSLSADGLRVRRNHYFVAVGEPPPENIFAPDATPFIVGEILKEKAICISQLKELPEEAHVDFNWLKQAGIKSFVAVPLIVDDDLRGYLSISSVNQQRKWTNDDLICIENIGAIFAIILDRQRSHKLLERKIQFETLLTDLSARLIKVSSRSIDMEINNSLTEVRELFKGDRCTLMRVRVEDRFCWVSHQSTADELEPLSSDLNLADIFPWSYEKLVVKGEHKNMSNIRDLPKDAEMEFAAWQSFKLKSSLSVPIFVEGKVVAIIAINSSTQEIHWPDEYVVRLRLLGEVCLNTCNRRDAELALRASKSRIKDKLKEITRLKKELETENIYLRENTSQLFDHTNIIAESKAMQQVLLQASQVAQTDSTVLLTGETGTGKELIARHIHKRSARNKRQMVTVNCASLQPSLIESELFGREKGAYTGAMTRMAGRFEVADGSTLFLDEIGELPFDLQSKLLRVLEEGTFERLGSTKTIHVNVRVVAATNRDLQQDVEKGNFRQDLFYRLNVFPVSIPPLRDHIDDIAPLIWLFVRQFGEKMGKQIENISRRSLNELTGYSWPGNVRELRNIIEYSMIISSGNMLNVSLPQKPLVQNLETCRFDLKSIEYDHILKVLNLCEWRVSGPKGAAEVLGVKRTTLQSKMKKLGIKRPTN